jgi:hypothetical protein
MLTDLDVVRNIMTSAAREANAEILKVAFHRFQPHGVSGVVVIDVDDRGKARYRVDQRSVHARRSRARRAVDGEALGLDGARPGFSGGDRKSPSGRFHKGTFHVGTTQSDATRGPGFRPDGHRALVRGLRQTFE